MSSARDRAARVDRSVHKRRAVRAFGALSAMALIAASFGVALGSIVETTPAGATVKSVIAETFQNANVSSPSSWVVPSAAAGFTNSACLTAGANTTQTPIRDCSASRGDAPGNGVLQLTNSGTSQIGGALDQSECPGDQRPGRQFRQLSVGRNRFTRDRLRDRRREPKRPRRAVPDRPARGGPRLLIWRATERPGTLIRLSGRGIWMSVAASPTRPPTVPIAPSRRGPPG